MKNIRKLIIAAMLCALAVTFKVFSSDLTPITRVSITPIPVMLCGIIFGPVFGGLCGIATDVLGFIAKPTGAYFPGFTLTMALYGVISGLFFLRKKRFKRILELVIAGAATVITQLFCSFFLNTYFTGITQGLDFRAAFAQRVITSSIQLGVYTILIVILYGVYINFIEPKYKKGELIE